MDVNYLAIVLAGFSAFFLGFVWYTLVFAKIWQREIGMDAKDGSAKAPNMAKMLAGSLALEIVMGFALALVIGKDADTVTGLRYGLIAGIGLVTPAFGVNYLFEGRSFKLWLINSGYNVLLFAIMGAILGAL